MATREFSIEINGINQSVSAVDSLIDRLDQLEDKIQSISDGGLDVSDLRQSLTSIRRELEDNVDSWEDVANKIEDVTDSVEQLEKQYARIDTPFNQTEIRNYSREVDQLAENLSDVADEAKSIDGLGNFNQDVQKATNSVNQLTDSLRNANRAEDQLGTKLTVNVGGMALQFDDVNQAIGVLEDKLYQLSATGQRDTQMFRDITAEIANLRMQVTQVDEAVDNAFSGGLNRLISGVGSIASLASVGEGLGQLFGLQDNALDESIQKFAALSLVLQGAAELQQQLANKTSLASQAFRVLNSIANPVITGLGKLMNTISFGAFDKAGESIDKFNRQLKAMDIRSQMEEFRKAAMLEEYQDAHSGWQTLLKDLEAIKKGLSEGIQFDSFREMAEQFADVSSIADQLKMSLEEGFIDQSQYDQATQALDKFKNGLSSDAVEAGKLKEELSGLGVQFLGIPPALTKTQKGLLLVTNGVKALGVAFKSLLRATIILGLLQVAMEAISWILEKVGKLWTSWAGDDSLATQLNTTTQAIEATNNALTKYVDNLQKLVDLNVISNQTRITESIKEYQRALDEAIKTQQALNAIRREGSKPLADNLDTNNTWWTGADIQNVQDFAKQFEVLQKAVQAGTDRVKVLKEETTAWYEIWKGQWWDEIWQTAGDASADFASAQKAVISDIQYRINNLDLSKGEDEIKKFLDLLDTPMYQISLANIENLFPEDEYAKVLAANIKQIKDYYKQIQDLQVQAEQEAQKIQDQITSNNISAIRNRFTREREELAHNEELELRDAADNEELKQSIRNKYAAQRSAMLKSQASEVRSIQNQINNNQIEAMQDGLKKQLAQLEQNRKQEIQSARDSEILVGEQIKAINEKYDKLILDAKREFYEQRKKLLEDYSKQYKDMQDEIAQMEYEIATSRIQNRATDQIEALGFTDETIENIRAYYDKVRDIQNRETQRLADANKEITSMGTDRDIDNENQRSKERLKQIEDDYKEGLLTKEQYDKAIQDETDAHYKMLETITRKGEQDLIDIQKEADQTIKNNNATAITERINALNEAYSNVRVKPQINSLGIIDYSETKDELKKAQNEYSQIFKEIANERENLQKSFDNNEISFGDFRQAKKELDSLEQDVVDAQNSIGLELNQLFTTVAQSLTQYVGQYVSTLGEIWSVYNDIQMMRIEQEMARLEEEYEILEDAYNKQEELTQKHTDKLADINDELKTSRGDRRAHLIEQLNAEREAMLASLQEEQRIEKQKEQNQKKQDALEKKRNEQEKKNKIVTATINAYTAMTNALAVQPWFVGLALSAVALAMGLAQVAMIKKQKYASGGLLKGASHQRGGIPVGMTGIEVEGDEYIINKNSTKKNLPLIDYINSSNKRLTKDDLIRFYDSGKKNVTRQTKSKFADGGLLPNVTVPTSQNELVITDDRPVVVQVVDIVNSADNYRQVQVLAGLEGSNSI